MQVLDQSSIKDQDDKAGFLSENSPLKKNTTFFERSFKTQLYQNRFINKLLQKKKQFQKLSIFQYKILGDYSTKEKYTAHHIGSNHYFGKINKSPFARFKRRVQRKYRDIQQSHFCISFEKLLSKIPIINPNNQVKLFWDFLMTIMRFYLLIVIPLEAAFNNKMLYNQLSWTLTASISMMILDIVINFDTSFYDKGLIVTDHTIIASKYIANGFIYDAFSAASLLIVYMQELNQGQQYISHDNQDIRKYNTSLEYLSVAGIIIQLQNVIRVFKRLQSFQDFSQTTALMIDLIQLVMFLFLVEHMFACIWYYVAITNKSDTATWITADGNLQNGTYQDQYIAAFYFTTVTMCTVGYGDIVPKNPKERIVCLLFMFASTLQLSYTVSTIWTIISKFQERHQDNIRKMRAINLYMQGTDISQQLRYKIREYLTFFWKEQEDHENMEVKDIISQLSPDLQENLQFEANSMIVQGCEFFRNYFSNEFKLELLKLLQSVTLTPGKQVYCNEPILYFIERGDLYVNQPFQKIQLHSLKKGDNFGLRQFILGEKINLQLTSHTFCKLLYLDREEFINLLRKYPQDLEQFSFIKDNMIYRESTFGSFCYCCHSQLHLLVGCPLLNYKPDRDFIIKRDNFPVPQSRTKFTRSRIKRKMVIEKEIRLDNDKQTIPSIESDESEEFELKESIKAGHHNYFSNLVHKKKKVQIDSKPIESNRFEITEVAQLEEELTMRDKQQLEILQLMLKPRPQMQIDQIRDYKYYYPQSNLQNVIKVLNLCSSQKLQINDSQWSNLVLYLRYPFDFFRQSINKIRKFRAKIMKVSTQSQAKAERKKKTVLVHRPVKKPS